MAIGDRPTVASQKAAAVAEMILSRAGDAGTEDPVDRRDDGVGRGGDDAAETEGAVVSEAPTQHSARSPESDSVPGPVVSGIGREADRAVLRAAMDLAARLRVQLVVVHVDTGGHVYMGLPAAGMAGPPVVPAEPPIQPPPRIQEMTASVAADLGCQEMPVSMRSGHGDPALVLGDVADEVGAYCIVVGSRGEGAKAVLSRMLRPSVSRGVLRERRVPVVIIPEVDITAAGAPA
jgi:nucleotide-binding universal stress UspA family protein